MQLKEANINFSQPFYRTLQEKNFFSLSTALSLQPTLFFPNIWEEWQKSFENHLTFNINILNISNHCQPNAACEQSGTPLYLNGFFKIKIIINNWNIYVGKLELVLEYEVWSSVITLQYCSQKYLSYSFTTIQACSKKWEGLFHPVSDSFLIVVGYIWFWLGGSGSLR